MNRQSYATDITDAEWRYLEPYMGSQALSGENLR
jgi:hypothetical protein